MKAAFLLKDLRLGGVEKITIKLISGLIDEGCQVTLFLFEAKGELLDQLSPNATLVGFKGSGKQWNRWSWAISALKALQPDALIISSGQIGLKLYMANGFVPLPTQLIAIQHIPLTLPGSSKIKNMMRRATARYYFSIVDHAVAVSEGIKAEIVNLIPVSDHVRRIYNPVIDEALTTTSAADPLHPAPSHKYFVAVGRLDFQKNYSLMFDAFRQFTSVHDDHSTQLVVLGDGPLQEELAREVSDKGLQNQVIFKGFVTNPYPYIKGAEALVMTSRWEGLPTVIIEALSLGTQVISVDCPTGPGELLKDGEYGFLCGAEDLDGIAESMLQIAKGVKKPSPQPFLSQFFIRHSAKEYVKLIAC